MMLIRVTEAESAHLISQIAAHIPVYASLGRVLAAGPNAVFTSEGVYGFDRADDASWRVVKISPGLYERTRWHAGEELVRHLVRDWPCQDAADEH